MKKCCRRIAQLIAILYSLYGAVLLYMGLSLVVSVESGKATNMVLLFALLFVFFGGVLITLGYAVIRTGSWLSLEVLSALVGVTVFFELSKLIEVRFPGIVETEMLYAPGTISLLIPVLAGYASYRVMFVLFRVGYKGAEGERRGVTSPDSN